MNRIAAAVFAALMLAIAIPLTAASPPDNWDGLVKVKSKKLDLVYLQPGADFRGYTKIILDPTVVSFRKNWQRDHDESREMERNVSEKDARRILDAAQQGMQKVFSEAYAKAGYAVVVTPDSDVLRISTAIINLDVAAPDLMTAGRSRSYSSDAGEATLVIEARDSISGALLGRAVDRRITDDTGPYVRNSVTNSAEFEEVFSGWAKAAATGLTELKALSPINTNGLQQKR